MPRLARAVVIPGWLVASLLVEIAANLLAGVATTATVGLMHGTSAFAQQARAYELTWLPVWRCVAYPVLTLVNLAYLWPIIVYFRECPEVPAAVVQRRAVNAPFVVAAIGFLGWISSTFFFPLITLERFGRWDPDLMSQQVLSPLVNGFLAATTSYLLIDWVFRTRVVPHVFPDGRTSDFGGVLAVGVGGRLVIFLVAVAFLPLFTMLGLVRAAAARLAAGWVPADVVPQLVAASQATFLLYLGLGLVLTLLVARTFTRPLAEVTAALRRVRAGTLDQPVRVSSADEIGVLEEGVNAMAATLRERERILQTFGRVVEPAVRDRLLAGELRGEGEVRTASILFCDLRGFTGLAERTAPGELVRTLNQFFSTMTSWARSCDGYVDSFVGDGLLVVFGLFDDDSAAGPARSAAAAVRCALGMRERLSHLNAERLAQGEGPLAVKIGVHTGPVIAGTIGAADRHAYTVIGDTVNVAARLEEVASELGCDVVVSARTWGLAAPTREVAAVADAARVTLRGRAEPVEVVRLGASVVPRSA